MHTFYAERAEKEGAIDAKTGSVAVDMDPQSLLCRLARSVPPPRFHTVKYSGVLAPASPWGSRLAPRLPEAADAGDQPGRPGHAGATARGLNFWRNLSAALATISFPDPVSWNAPEP